VSGDEAADRRLREILGEVPLEGDATPDCPSPETIWDAASGLLSPGRVGSLGEHAAGCRACTAIWREATILTRAAATAGGAAPPSRRPPTHGMGIGWPLLAALAATLALTIVGVCLFQLDPPPAGGAAVQREPEARSIRSLVPEAAPIARDEFRLRWTEGVAGARYRVQVTTANLDLLAEGRDLGSPEFLVPIVALRDVASGETVLWQVEAVAPDGSRVTSPTFLARLR